MTRHVCSFAVIGSLALAAPALAQARIELFRRAAEQRQDEAARLVKERAAADASLRQATEKAEETHREAVENLPPAEKAAVADVANQVMQAKAASEKTATVTAEQTKALVGNLNDFYAANATAANHYDTAATAIAIAGILLSLTAAIAGFLQLSKAAGIVSLVITALLAVPKALPLEDRAKYYRVLSVQTYSLLLETQLARSETPEMYDDQARRFRLLVQYAAEKFPNSSDIAATSADLIKDLGTAAPASHDTK